MAAIPIPRFYIRASILVFALIALCLIDFLFTKRDLQYQLYNDRGGSQLPLAGSNGNARDRRLRLLADRLDLTEGQCKELFPGLTWNVDENVKKGKFGFKRSDPDYKGLVQGRIHKNKLYILTTAPDTTPEILHQRTAILSQIHRALITSPSLLPSTHFAFVINDSPKNNSWVFATPNKVDRRYNTWLMPHFGFWSWAGKGKDMGLGAADEVFERISAVESSTPWEKKTDKVVWRGTPWFNPVGHPTLRQDLLKASKNREWADIEALNVTTQGTHSNAVRIEAFCSFRYVVYTEGVTYSGRLPYHQACASVLLTAPLTYLTHTAHLLRPIDADVLMGAFESSAARGKPAYNGPPPPVSKSTIEPLLATVQDWRTANAVYLQPTFANLERTVVFLREHPEVATRIAANQRALMDGGGYLSAAAETCYWRGLIQGWASVAEVSDEEGDGEDVRWAGEQGERFENWIVRQVASAKEREMQGVGARGRIVGRGSRGREGVGE